MANSVLLTGIQFLCFILCVSGDDIRNFDQGVETMVDSVEKTVESLVGVDTNTDSTTPLVLPRLEIEDTDGHRNSSVVRRENGKKQKSKGKKPVGEWKPKNVVAAPTQPPETPKEKQKRLFAEFVEMHKRKKNNKVVLDEELEGLDDFFAKVNKAKSWVAVDGILSKLGEVGQQTLKRFPELQEDLMVPEKKEREAAAKKFLEKAEEIKEDVLSDKMRQHADFMYKMKDMQWDSYQDQMNDKTRRLMEFDEAAQRHAMRGKPRRPLGDGQDLPSPYDL